jgi:hypothetical protein
VESWVATQRSLNPFLPSLPPYLSPKGHLVLNTHTPFTLHEAEIWLAKAKKHECCKSLRLALDVAVASVIASDKFNTFQQGVIHATHSSEGIRRDAENSPLEGTSSIAEHSA